MDIKINNYSKIIFDLDDTLYNEYDFLISGYRAVSNLFLEDAPKVFEVMLDAYNKQLNAFDVVLKSFNTKLSLHEMLSIYRTHMPSIELRPEVSKVLNSIKTHGVFIGLMTDGRSITQRNKIKALGLDDFFDQIIVSEEFGSEKPNAKNYQAFMTGSDTNYVFIADNPSKDFVTANKLSWLTIGLLDNGLNIHKQNLDLSPEYLPMHWINAFSELHFLYEH